MSMRALLLSLCLARSAEMALGGQAPIITTDIVYGTYELLSDACSTAWAKADVDGVLAKLPLDDLKKTITQQVSSFPPEVSQALSEAQTKSVQLKAAAFEHTNKAYEAANTVAVGLIEKFESAAPAYAGLVPKTLGNLVLFALYLCVVLYVQLKVLLFALRAALCICCCGCCCCRRGKKGSAAATNGKTKAKAAPGSGKAAPKAASTKKGK